MTRLSYRTSRPCHWVEPRQRLDASQRYMTHGKVQPMHEPSWFARLFGRA